MLSSAPLYSAVDILDNESRIRSANTMQTKIVDIGEAQRRLMELVSLVVAGTEVILTEGSKPLARMVPVTAVTTPRIAGLHPGAIWTSDDFDEPLPDDFWTGAI
jgi:antitoxin (DNA-binding transcriptional repressor) of toxin-antitoxin stability system